jgi:deoxyribose-phosphate aldolase
MSLPTKTTVSLPSLAKMIDHSLLHPTMTDSEIEAGVLLSRQYNVATACIKPYSISQAKQILAGSTVKVCAVIGFPHGNSATKIKVIEAQEAVAEGAHEIDMVVNIGKVLGGDWEYVAAEISAVNFVVTQGGAILKVIFENDYLSEKEIVSLSKICTEVGVAFVKTSTGYGFVKDTATGMYSYKGATFPHLQLMRAQCGAEIQIKAAGGVRTLDDLIKVKALGVTRVGATATVPMLEEARKRGIDNEEVEVQINWDDQKKESTGAY